MKEVAVQGHFTSDNTNSKCKQQNKNMDNKEKIELI